MARLLAKRRRDLRNGILAGAGAGFVAVLLTAGATRRAIAWHSFLLETLLVAVAGLFVARSGGGPLRGILLFGGAYLLAFVLRALGLDPSVLFLAGDLSAAPALQGHYASLAFLVGAGAAIGHVIESSS